MSYPLETASPGKLGLDPEALPGAEAVRQLRGATIREELLAALDNWLWCKDPTDPGRARLRAVADGADDNAWRRDLREAAGRRDGERLQALARDARALEQPPAVLALCGEALQQAGRPETAANWLRQALRRHGGDFWLNHHLAYVLFAVLRPPRTDRRRTRNAGPWCRGVAPEDLRWATGKPLSPQSVSSTSANPRKAPAESRCRG